MKMMGKYTCGWSSTDPIYIEYHDTEWGVPLHDDRKIFEFLTLESFQAGLSWLTILRKRGEFRKAFEGFDPEVVSQYGKAEVSRLLRDKGIVRNRLKIEAAVRNASAFVVVRDEFGSMDKYMWQFVGGRPKKNAWKSLNQIPAVTNESVMLSSDLKKRGFSFVGPTVCYSHMQATGMVNDHLVRCFRHDECSELSAVGH